MATLQEAAEKLGVSAQTVRRWVKAGRLPATMEDSPYGPAYAIPDAALNTAQLTTDVVVVNRANDPAILGAIVAQAIEQVITERDAALAVVLDSVKDELGQLVASSTMAGTVIEAALAQRDQTITELRRELAQVSAQLTTLTELVEQQHAATATTRRSWWRW